MKKIAVIGAGNMGSGIAQKVATEGIEVRLIDLGQAQLEKGLRSIEATLTEAVERRIMPRDRARAARERIAPAAEIGVVRDCDLVIEAVFEDLDVKLQLFKDVARVVSPTAILATNTSSFRVSDLAERTPHPERVLGMHYFYHPAKNRLVEVIGTDATDAAALQAAWRFNERLGKTPIRSSDSPGFIVNRFFVPWLNEAVRLFEEGVASIPLIERVAREAFGIGMGPFELMNVTGVPIAYHAASTLGQELGPFYEPAAALAAQVHARAPWDLAKTPEVGDQDEVRDRLLAVVFLVATEIVEERVGRLEDVDIGARVGLRWRAGPFEMMNAAGPARAIGLVRPLSMRHDLEVPGLLVRHVARSERFAFELVKLEVQDGIATITINRPDALNALNEQVVQQLGEKFDAADADASVTAIVLAGAGKAFVAGADIRYFVQKIEQGKLGDIVAFTRCGHDLLNRFGRSRKPVIARLDGLALGGGAELLLACDYVVATPRASIAFPETGIGIYPGLGGTQRLRARCGIGLAKYLIYSGKMLSAEMARDYGVIDQVVAHEDLDRAIRALAEAGKPKTSPRPPSVQPEPIKVVARFFERVKVPELLSGTARPDGDPALEKDVQRIREQKAPLALKLAEKLIERGAQGSLEEGLRLEIDHLQEIFRTRDALEGLSSVGVRKPTFVGA